jgi:hypothetical protein
MRSSHEVRPKKQGNRKSADYRSGYADGLLAAHCLLVMGSHPKQNEKEIWEILKADNAQNSAERVDEDPPGKPKALASPQALCHPKRSDRAQSVSSAKRSKCKSGRRRRQPTRNFP